MLDPIPPTQRSIGQAPVYLTMQGSSSNMIRLVIKGDKETAMQAALKRGLLIETKDLPFKLQKEEEVYADIDESHMLDVVQWFCQPQIDKDGVCLPGTLLYYA